MEGEVAQVFSNVNWGSLFVQLPIVGLLWWAVTFFLKRADAQQARHDAAMERKDTLFSAALDRNTTAMTQLREKILEKE